MQVKSVSRYLKISPRKVRQVIDLVRNQEAEVAMSLLAHLNKGAAPHVRKAIQAAVANARRLPQQKTGLLYVARITASEGPTRTGRRFRAAAMGRGVRIRRRQTHLAIELEAR
ncbi:MAG: 50S ribosomal protein L22 [Candidatus Omnitrophica bacterium]|nr:50S ribosomal protein L22 [Candidatus Omnitrophota bacterium]